MTINEKLLEVAFSHGEGYLKTKRPLEPFDPETHTITLSPGKWHTVNEPLIKVSDAMVIIDAHLDEVLRDMMTKSPDLLKHF